MRAGTERSAIPMREPVAEFARIGVTAFTTTRALGDFAVADPVPDPDNVERWRAVQRSLEPAPCGLACALQVHGTDVAEHSRPWDSWVRLEGFDAHVVTASGGAAAVTVADCVPVFIAHPCGAVAIVHAGWRGVAGRILVRALIALEASLNSHSSLRDSSLGARFSVRDCSIHLGPSICGRCYEVGPDVYRQLTGWETIRHRHVDLRALLGEQAKEVGVGQVSASQWCTKCDNDRFFSHRAGDAGRQIAVIVSSTA
jgi:copper oxidase (laccase) domain-containing protein